MVRENKNYAYPLYTYENIFDNEKKKQPNLNPDTYKKIQNIIPNVSPEQLFDYIYGILHSQKYRSRYAEFLKVDFPKIPYPKDNDTFNKIALKGKEIRELHLLESPLLEQLDVKYPINGDNIVDKIGKNSFKNGKVYINAEQYFDGVSETAWNFYIGGYQPAQKWLKDRKGQELSFDDINHYRKIIKSLHETDRIMQEINEINIIDNQ